MKTSNNGFGPDDYGKDSPYGNGDSGRGQMSRSLARRPGTLAPFRRQGAIQEGGPMLPPSLMEQQEKRRFSFADYMGLLWRGKWIILCCVIVAGVAAAYYTYSQPFVYKSSLQIIINEQDQNMSPLLGSNTWYWQPPERVLKKELQILTSQPILQQTAEQLIARRYLDTVKRDSVIPVIVSSEHAVNSRYVRVTPEEKSAALVTTVANSIKGLITFRPSKEADIIQIVTLAGDPREAALITNVYAKVYEKDNQQQNRSKAKSVKDFLGERLKATRDSLSKQEMELRNYQQGNGILGMGEQTTDLIGANSKLQTDATEAQIQISSLSKKILESKRQLRNYDSTLPAEVSSAVPLYIEQMQRELTQLDVDEQLIKATNQARASEQWYQNEIKARDEKIKALRDKLYTEVAKYKASMMNSMAAKGSNGTSTSGLAVIRQQIFDDEIQLQALQAKLSAITGKRAEIQGKMSQVPGQMLDMERLQRDKSGLEKIYMQLNEDYNRKVLEEQSVFSSVRLLETAQVLPSPISPNRPADIATGSFAGLGLGIGIVLLIAFIDTTIHTPEELEKNGFVMLTAIPTIRSDMFDPNAMREDITITGKVSPHLITQVNPKSPVAEAYRSLRTGIQYASIEEATRTILVTSSTPQEGKSTTSVNTAIVFAQSGSKTLLIDCDLRRPIVHSVFGMAKEPGLVNCLIGTTPIDEAVYHTLIPNLDVLASGSIPPNPSELLGSRRMRDLLDELRLRYDTIVLDSPPTAAVTDAVILSTLADITIVVVRAHKTKLEFLEKTRTELERVFVSPLGVVLNDFDVSQSYGSAYKYYRYYKYYGYYGQSSDAGSRRKQRRADAVRNLPPADGV